MSLSVETLHARLKRPFLQQDPIAVGQQYRFRYGLTFSMGLLGGWLVVVARAKAAVELLLAQDFKALAAAHNPTQGDLVLGLTWAQNCPPLKLCDY